MTTVLLDTHVLHWWSEDSPLLSKAAVRTLERADELAVSPVSWLELATLARRGRIVPAVPVRTWLEQLAQQVRTAPLSPAIAARAAELPPTFPKDPFDRVIYSTAIEHGWRLATKDDGIRNADSGARIVVW